MKHTVVKAKKYLGQHFLKDPEIAKKIADTLTLIESDIIIEVGCGTGILTSFLLERKKNVIGIEIDTESVEYLSRLFKHTPNFKLIKKDFLKINLKELINQKPFSLIGNYPYNISTQIVFKMIENRVYIPEFSGMFQKEVAERICSKKGSKIYGILSVWVAAFYTADYKFTVNEDAFDPPPKIKSGVVYLKRKQIYNAIGCNESLLLKVIKLTFNYRRKTIRNSLKLFNLPKSITQLTIFDKRPEHIDLDEFINLTNIVYCATH